MTGYFQNQNLIINMVYKDSKEAKIIKIFQLEVGALASKIIHPEVTILSRGLRKLDGQTGFQKKILTFSFA